MSEIQEGKKIPLKYIDVKSSNIKQVAYNQDNKLFGVIFESKKEYHYNDVPPAKVLGLLFADSVGKYFNENIRDSFKYKEQ